MAIQFQKNRASVRYTKKRNAIFRKQLHYIELINKELKTIIPNFIADN